MQAFCLSRDSKLFAVFASLVKVALANKKRRRFPKQKYNVLLCVVLRVALRLHHIALNRASFFSQAYGVSYRLSSCRRKNRFQRKAPDGPWATSIARLFGCRNTTWFWRGWLACCDNVVLHRLTVFARRRHKVR